MAAVAENRAVVVAAVAENRAVVVAAVAENVNAQKLSDPLDLNPLEIGLRRNAPPLRQGQIPSGFCPVFYARSMTRWSTC